MGQPWFGSLVITLDLMAGVAQKCRDIGTELYNLNISMQKTRGEAENPTTVLAMHLQLCGTQSLFWEQVLLESIRTHTLWRPSALLQCTDTCDLHTPVRIPCCYSRFCKCCRSEPRGSFPIGKAADRVISLTLLLRHPFLGGFIQTTSGLKPSKAGVWLAFRKRQRQWNDLAARPSFLQIPTLPRCLGIYWH